MYITSLAVECRMIFEGELLLLVQRVGLGSQCSYSPLWYAHRGWFGLVARGLDADLVHAWSSAWSRLDLGDVELG